MNQVRLTFILLFVLMALLLGAGCESQSSSAAAPAGTTVSDTPIITARTTTTQIPPASTIRGGPAPEPDTATNEPAPGSAGITVQSGNNHQEYIKMDAISYTIGEVVQFYLVNKGPEIKGCDYAHPAYTIYHLSPDGTRLSISQSDPVRSYFTVISGGDPGSVTGPFSLDTRKMTPGRYLIRFDCGNNVAREFVLMGRL